MGLILDTSILIATERRGKTVEDILSQVRTAQGNVAVALSAVSIVELTHGIYRARTEADRARRAAFAEAIFNALVVHSISTEIAKLAGRIEGEQAGQGNVIPFEDLLIGATALHLGFGVATLNLRHFERIPGLKLVTV